jgi:hypothetical protein
VPKQSINKALTAGVIIKKILSSVFLGALLTIGMAAIAAETAADPVVGTWKLRPVALAADLP